MPLPDKLRSGRVKRYIRSILCLTPKQKEMIEKLRGKDTPSAFVRKALDAYLEGR